MDIRGLILRKLNKQKEIKVADIVKATGFTRAYINRFFQELKNENKIVLLGRANQARYVLAGSKEAREEKKGILSIRKFLKNVNLAEDKVLAEIKQAGGIFLGLPKNVASVLNYAFTEMLNNAIEHSRSKNIVVKIKRAKSEVVFEVIDKGIGIFANVMRKRKLNDEMDAIGDILKGKQTTSPKEHSGEGIFFTSKVAGKLTITSHQKKLMFDNVLNDIFVADSKHIVGTKVRFEISTNSKTELDKIFKEYTSDAFLFDKTRIVVDLYKMGAEFVSRSQARRIVSGLEKFKTIILDFKGVESVGQGFADEVFRVWQKNHPKIKIAPQNANENVQFMINRASFKS